MKKIIILILSLFLLSGCFRAKTVERQKYLLTLKTPTTIKNRSKTRSVYVAPTTIVRQFSGTDFIYRTRNNLYVSDYYHGFFISPENQIHQAIVNHFTNNTSIMALDEINALEKMNYLLNTKVLLLYADYKNPNNPLAVMSIQFTLYHLKKNSSKPVYQKIFLEKTSLKAKDSDSLVQAWNIDLQKILHHLKINFR